MTPFTAKAHVIRNLAVALLAMATPLAAGSWSAMISSENSLEFKFLKDDAPVFHLSLAGWGPNWQWVGLAAKNKATGDRLDLSLPFVVNQASGEVIDVRFQAWQSGPRELKFRYDLKAAKDVPLTMLIASLGVEKEFAEGQWQLTHPDGKTSELKLPVGITSRPAATKALLSLKQAGDIALAFDPACGMAFDQDLRVLLAQDKFPAGSRSVTLTVTLPDKVTFLARQEDLDRLTRSVAGPDWFAFAPPDTLGPSVIGMEDWLEKPAGKHGGVRLAGDRFQFTDGTPVKFWGVNLSYGGGCAPEKGAAEFTAARYAKYGINAVRLHKFSYPTNQMGITDPQDSTRMTPEGLDRLDYFSAQLKARGIYYAWSHTFGFQVTPGQRDRLLAYDEIEKNLQGKTYGFINLAEDVQNLMIEMVVGLLKHRNPHTGLTYAADPALAYIELQNEDDIFFYTTEKAFNACPTYQRHFIERFTRWLAAKYGSEEALRKAWGEALQPGETLAANNIVPQTNPWFFGADNLPKQTGGPRQRLLDAAQHFHELQNQFYARFVKAIRQAGYQGPLCGSPWQAPAMLPHYLNLRSDALVGFIDRHNYFGGGLFDTLLTKPGDGYFQHRPPAGGRSAVRLERVDPRLSVALQRGGSGARRGLRAGLAGVGCQFRVSVTNQPAPLQRPRGLAAVGRLGSGCAHPVGPISRPRADDLSARRRRRENRFHPPGKRGGSRHRKLQFLRPSAAAGRPQDVWRHLAGRDLGGGPGGRGIHGSPAAKHLPGPGEIPPGHRLAQQHGATALGHGRQGVFHGQHARHQGRRRFRRGQAAAAWRRDHRAAVPLRQPFRNGHGARRHARHRQERAGLRRGPQLQHRVHVFHRGRQDRGQRQGSAAP
jgi:hypothetical protein